MQAPSPQLVGDHKDDQKKERTRTYAEAVAGVTNSMHFDASDHSFTLEYVLDESIGLPTEIRINKEVNYPNGFDVVIGGEGSEGLEWLWDEVNDPFVLSVRLREEEEGRKGSESRVVTVKITAL